MALRRLFSKPRSIDTKQPASVSDSRKGMIHNLRHCTVFHFFNAFFFAGVVHHFHYREGTCTVNSRSFSPSARTVDNSIMLGCSIQRKASSRKLLRIPTAVIRGVYPSSFNAMPLFQEPARGKFLGSVSNVRLLKSSEPGPRIDASQKWTAFASTFQRKLRDYISVCNASEVFVEQSQAMFYETIVLWEMFIVWFTFDLIRLSREN